VLVVGQLAVSVILLVGALLLIRAYQRLQQVDLGVQSDRVLTFGIVIPPAHQEDLVARRTLDAIDARLSATPGVESVGGMSSLPLAGAGPLFAFRIEDRPDPRPGETPWNVRYLTVMPHVFQTLRVPLKRGRLLHEGDIDGRPLVAVINEAAARLYWPGGDPVGRTIRFNPQETNPSIQIVGVVGDVRSLGPGVPAPPTAYLPLGQSGPPPATLGRIMRFVVRTTGNPADMAASARAAVNAVDAGLPLLDLRPMIDVVSAASGQPRFTTLVMSVFASAAFLLAALGLYGILAYNVEQRTREIGVRVALGASRRDVLRLVIGHGMRLTLIGAMVGVPAAMIVTRLTGGMLPGITNADPVIYAAVVLLLVASAFLASYVPARRATKVDPLVALRSD
jgi:predicted permease